MTSLTPLRWRHSPRYDYVTHPATMTSLTLFQTAGAKYAAVAQASSLLDIASKNKRDWIKKIKKDEEEKDKKTVGHFNYVLVI